MLVGLCVRKDEVVGEGLFIKQVKRKVVSGCCLRSAALEL